MKFKALALAVVAAVAIAAVSFTAYAYDGNNAEADSMPCPAEARGMAGHVLEDLTLYRRSSRGELRVMVHKVSYAASHRVEVKPYGKRMKSTTRLDNMGGGHDTDHPHWRTYRA